MGRFVGQSATLPSCFEGDLTLLPCLATPAAPLGLNIRVPGDRRPDVQQPVGSFWFQAEVDDSGTFVRSYGIEGSDKRGLNPKVFRVSRRHGKGYLGFLTSFFNVPGLFGSIPYQRHNYVGVDCADVLVAAYCKWKNTRIKKDQCVAGLVTGLPKVLESELRDGNPTRRIRWDKDVRAGYLLAVRYVGAKVAYHGRKWQVPVASAFPLAHHYRAVFG